MGESLIAQCTWLEAEIEVTREELRDVAQKGADSAEICRVADRLGDQIRSLASLRERAAASSYRNLAKEIAAQLLRMAKKIERPSVRAIAAGPHPEDANKEEIDRAAGQLN
jgi:hypothetical protein